MYCILVGVVVEGSNVESHPFAMGPSYERISAQLELNLPRPTGRGEKRSISTLRVEAPDYSVFRVSIFGIVLIVLRWTLREKLGAPLWESLY